MKKLDVEGELGYASDRGESVNKWISQVYPGLKKKEQNKIEIIHHFLCCHSSSLLFTIKAL